MNTTECSLSLRLFIVSIRGIMLFVVILLIGTGWTFIKSYLNDKDKKILLVVIPLQVLANIAMIVVGESSPGSQQWLTWVFSQTINISIFSSILTKKN
jgi:cell division protein FtsW (lipid II flippase)